MKFPSNNRVKHCVSPYLRATASFGCTGLLSATEFAQGLRNCSKIECVHATEHPTIILICFVW